MSSKSFVFYESYLESIEELSNDLKLEVLLLIINYGIRREEINDVSSTAKSIFKAHKFNIDKSLERRRIAIENGSKGGAPKGNNNAKQPKSSKNNQNDYKNNLNDNVNVNANVNEDVNLNDNENIDVNNNVNFNEDVNSNENRIVKGRGTAINIRSLTSKDTRRIANNLNIEKEKVQYLYSELEKRDFTSDYGEVIETDIDFIKYLESIKEYERQ